MSGRLRKLVLVMMVVLVAPSGALAAERLILATTTSTENSGLLAHLLPPLRRSIMFGRRDRGGDRQSFGAGQKR